MRNGTRHACSLAMLGSSESSPPPMSGMTTKRAEPPARRVPQSASACATSMFEPLTLNTSSAPASTARRISPASSESTLTRRPAPVRSRTMSPSSGNSSPGVQPISMTSAPDARKRSASRRTASRVSRGALLISATISISHSPYSWASADRPKWRGRSRRSLGPFSTRTPTLSVSSVASPSHNPGIITRSVPSGTTSDRAIQEVVISAATVILRTATSQRNAGDIPPSTRRSDGSASVPVTNRMRCGASGLTGPEGPALRTSVIPADRRSARICSASLRGPRPPWAATTPRPRFFSPARSPCR